MNISENELIYGKLFNDFVLNQSELQFMKNEPFNEIMSNKEKKDRLMAIFKKIGSLSVVQRNIQNILNGFNISTQTNEKNYTTQIRNILKNSNSKLETINGNNQSKSILILYLLLNYIISYIKKRSSNEQSYKEIRYLIRKFLNMREKIYQIIQLQYIEPIIPKERAIVNNYYYYHLYRPLIMYILNENNITLNDDSLLPSAHSLGTKKVEYNYENVKNYFLFRSEALFYKINSGENNSNNNTSLNSNFSTNYVIYNFGEFQKKLNIRIYNKENFENKNIKINHLNALYFRKEEENNNRRDFIICKRNDNFYIYEYVIKDKQILQSKKVKSIYIGSKNLNIFLVKNHPKYGLLEKVVCLDI